MTDRPLRPVTDRCLGRPLPYQLANLPQASLQARGLAIPRFNNCLDVEPLHYAVLAQVSLGYSPPKGRLPTRYSPGRHSTHSRRNFRVRLACVRHAASVDSEPGSNSHVKILIVLPADCSTRKRPCQTSVFQDFSSQFSTYTTLCLVFKYRPSIVFFRSLSEVFPS